MESTESYNIRIEKFQKQMEQMIQRSRDAELKEESQYYLCLADLYSLAISDDKTNMFGSTLTMTTGSDDDAVAKVCIEVRTDFASRSNYFECSFSQWTAVPGKLLRSASEKRFTTAEDAYNFIVGLANKINAFFNNIQK